MMIVSRFTALLLTLSFFCVITASEHIPDPDEAREQVEELLARAQLTTTDRGTLVSHASIMFNAVQATDYAQALLWARVLARLPTSDPVPDEEQAILDQALTAVLPLILAIHKDYRPDYKPHRVRPTATSGGIVDLTGNPPPPPDAEAEAERLRKLAENQEQNHLRNNWRTLQAPIRRILQARIPITEPNEDIDTWKQLMIDHVVSLIPEELHQQAAAFVNALYTD